MNLIITGKNKTAGQEVMAIISLRGSEAPGFAFGSPTSRRCTAGAARRTRFHPASPSAHLLAVAARRAPLAELVFLLSYFRECCTLL